MLFRGSTSRNTIAAVYNAIGNQLRPVSPGTAPPNRSVAPTAAAQPPPAAAETVVDSAVPEDAPRNESNVTSYSRQEVTSIGAGVTQKTTTETEDRGGVTVTKVTRELTVSGGPATTAPERESTPAESGTSHRSSTVLFHSVPVPKLKVQPMRWTPSGVGTKEHSLEDKENAAPNNKRRDIFGELGGEPQKFKVYKTTAKRVVWQPSDVPSLPVREPSPVMKFEVLETREFQGRPQQEQEGSRPPRHSDAVDGTDDSDPFGLSPRLFHVLTTEGTYDEDFILGRKSES